MKKRIRLSKPKAQSKSEARTQKIDEMYRSIEAACFMHIDDQSDAIYMGSLLLTAAKNMFLQFLGKERTVDTLKVLTEEVIASNGK